jgi:Ca2+-binding RTX toxin-like protein
MSFQISFDYRFDTAGFFDDPAARAALEEAARLWEEAIGDEFAPVPAGVSFWVSNPSTGASELITLDQEIDDILIFMGASTAPFGVSMGGDAAALPEGLSCDCALCTGETAPAGALARAGFSGTSAAGDVFSARVSGNFRGEGPVTDFEPWAGVFGVNTSYDWSFDLSGPVAGEFDFLTVALHEIGHALGLGTAPAFDEWISGGAFTGPNATAANGGEAVPLDPGEAHVAAGHAGNTVVMDPSISSGQRVGLSDIDLGLLADIGYEVPGLAPQGTQPAITTEGDDQTVFGTVVADLLDGLGGADRLQGNAGADTLRGGPGDDTLFGQDGADQLAGGTGADMLQGGSGADTLAGGAGADDLWGEGGTDVFRVLPGAGIERVNDFDLAAETLSIAAGFGFATVGEVLATISKPFSNVTRLQLDAATAVDIFHASQSGSPIGARHIELEAAQPQNAPPSAADDAAGVTAGQSVTIDALANDADPDGDALSIPQHGEPGTGTLAVVEDRFVFTAPADYSGSVSWSYTASDGRGGTDTATVTVTVSAADLVIDGTSGADVRYAGDGADTLRGAAGDDTLGGRAGDDRLEGGNDHDLLYGEAGDDALEGGYGFDTLFGNDGADSLGGDLGDDADGQGDVLDGGAGGDTLAGHGGPDSLYGGDGADLIGGGQGFDVAFAGSGDDTLSGGTEGDRLDGEAGDDSLSGESGGDILVGGAGEDTISGGGGDDFVDAGAEGDAVDLGPGDDILLARGGPDTALGGRGVDVMLGGGGDDSLFGGEDNDRLFGEGGADTVDGGAGDDLAFGNGGEDSVSGGSGADFVIGEDGDDALDGGPGADLVAGGSGADTLLGGTGDDLLDGGAGDDALHSGAGADILFGRDGADALSGGEGDDFLLAGAEADTLTGGTGNDSLAGDGGADLFVVSPGDGDDLVVDFTPGSDTIRFADGVAGLEDLAIAAAPGGGSLIGYGAADSLTLRGVEPSELAAGDDFLFG